MDNGKKRKLNQMIYTINITYPSQIRKKYEIEFMDADFELNNAHTYP